VHLTGKKDFIIQRFKNLRLKSLNYGILKLWNNKGKRAGS
jgi:hypothetical protein